MATRFILSTSPEQLAAAIQGMRSVTVEAEYGEKCVDGSIATLAHHGPRKDNPCPCLLDNSSIKEELDVVAGSHFDLDYLGGALAVVGLKPEAPGFWNLAAFVDVNGPHKLAQSGAAPADIRRLYAFWAWSANNRVWAPKEGTVIDVTEKVMEGRAVLERILADDPELLSLGDKFQEDEEELNRLTFIELRHGVVVRVANGFANHLYVTPGGEVGKACVTLRLDVNGITISLADPIDGVNCAFIAEALFGPKAGGHATIAGSPRGEVMTAVDHERAITATATALLLADE